MRVAVVIPVYNEARWVRAAVERLLATPAPAPPGGAPCERTIILVDDGSTDGTTEIVEAMGTEGLTTPVHHGVNCGKGAALRTGFQRALDLGADIVLVHDADLEYDPADHAAALAPILDGRADAVVGSRFIGQTHRVLYYWHYIANKVITTFCGMVTNLNLSDVECCTKAFTAEALRKMTLTENRFGIEIEMIARVARARLSDPGADSPKAPHAMPPRVRRARVYEVAVSYSGRTYEEGKKITWQDGAAALWCIVKHGLL
ncbi:Undecaprenyl-phosphate mannosyltransferase [Phycisphaerales bacterium]|nr:Undecaprenyl-phosphate mannosyltransferase [Phycisphaerales bacterium]